MFVWEMKNRILVGILINFLKKWIYNILKYSLEMLIIYVVFWIINEILMYLKKVLWEIRKFDNRENV